MSIPKDDLKLCTISDGSEAVLLLASLIARLEGVMSRTDLSFLEAPDKLRASEADAFDLLVIAPSNLQRSPDTLREILKRASGMNAELFLLLPEGAPPPAKLPETVRLLSGPPFPTGGLKALIDATSPHKKPDGHDTKPLSGRRFPLLRRRTPPHSDAFPAADPLCASGPVETLIVQGTCGGAGGTTLAVNLASEIATSKSDRDGAPAVCLIDLNMQFGCVSTYLGLQETRRVSDAYRKLRQLDAEAFLTSSQGVDPGLLVFTAPPDLVPMDILGGKPFEQLLDCARAVAPLVIIDMPPIVTQWSEQAFRTADLILSVNLLEIRAAQNARRLTSIINKIGTPPERIKHLLNRSEKVTARDTKLRIENFEAGIGAPFETLLPDGGNEIGAASDLGKVLSAACPSNPLTKSIRQLAQRIPVRPSKGKTELHEVNDVDL
ncbi:AAA family ATPase [Thioclava electrotropha]|uniref:AAA domain-containing protein n=1 Tax=Thioclava electrotropha TaxID=1549850 RepID=A0ABX6Z096_9RHOB|nr:hypothetical protein [Thioclava electrotropha]QPZ93363.1 hypothetical protein AKL02_020495 [Thioclava electrotropha]